MSASSRSWRWREGTVNQARDYLELGIGGEEADGRHKYLPVALVGKGAGRTFIVQFLIKPSDPAHRYLVRGVKEELDLILVKKGEPDQWEFAKHWCRSTSNFYGPIHWSFRPGRATNTTARNPPSRLRSGMTWSQPSRRKRSGGTPGVCFYCGEHQAELSPLRNDFKDEAAWRVAWSKQPCKQCAEKMAQGITFIEADRTADGDPSPTGRWCVLIEEDAKRRVTTGPWLEMVLKKRKCFIEPDAYTKLIGQEDTELSELGRAGPTH